MNYMQKAPVVYQGVQGSNERDLPTHETPSQRNREQKLPHQVSHSVGRELQGMGLITQVKQGESVPTTAGLKPAQMAKLQAHQKHIELDEQDEMQPLLKAQRSNVRGRKTLVLDLDETLVHSSFKPPKNPDIVLPVDIEGRLMHVYVLVRPGCIKFLTEMAKYYEVVIFTASLSKYADPLMDILDQNQVAPQRLFREHCTFHNGIFVKDMSRLGRPLKDVIIIDNSPSSYLFQPENGMPILSWYDEKNDTKLFELIQPLKLMSEIFDVRPVIQNCTSPDNVFDSTEALLLSERLLADMRRHNEIAQQEQARIHQQYNMFHKKRRSSDDEGENKSSMLDARITTEDGACIDENVKRLKAISETMQGKIRDKNKKMDDKRIAASQNVSKRHQLQNEMINDQKAQKKKIHTVESERVLGMGATQQKYSQTPIQSVKSSESLTISKNQQHSLANTMYKTQKSNLLSKEVEQTLKQTSTKKRPKTASKDSRINDTPLVQKKPQSTLRESKISQNSNQKLEKRAMEQQVNESGKKKGIVITSSSINFYQKSKNNQQDQTPSYLNNTKNKQYKRGSSATISTTSSSDKLRPQTAKIQSKHSLDRNNEKSGKPSLKKKGSSESDSLNYQPKGKGYQQGTFLTNMNKNEIHSPIAQTIQQQLLQKNSTNNSQQLETPPTKNQVALISKMNQNGSSPNVIAGKNNLSAKKSKNLSTQSSVKYSHTPHSQLEGLLYRPVTESTRHSQAKSPGKIFNFDKKNQNSQNEESYTALMKTNSQQQLRPSLQFTFGQQAPQNNGDIINQKGKNSQQFNTVKQVKVINNKNSAHMKYKNQIQTQNQNNYSKEQNKSGKISTILNEFERTKNFNEEIMKNLGSPKGPFFARQPADE